MWLKLKNIGMILEANIEIRGITVIAGKNQTGKSTVSKALFSIFNSFYQVEKKIFNEKVAAISTVIRKTLIPLELELRPSSVTRNIQLMVRRTLLNESVQTTADVANAFNDLCSKVKQFSFLKKKIFKNNSPHELIAEIEQKIAEVLNISGPEFISMVLQKNLQTTFAGQIINLNKGDDNGEIILHIKNKQVKISVSSDKSEPVSFDNTLNLNTEAIYIDDPLIMDTIKTRPFRDSSTLHRAHLVKKLQLGVYSLTTNEEEKAETINRIIASKKIAHVLEKFNRTCAGELVTTEHLSIAYKDAESGKIFEMLNLSTGLKMFAILKTLLLNGTIEENGLIILDEPESHLHPEWQLIFAEIIVLLQIEFNLHLLINTHSPYFISALELYSKKHDLISKTKYYCAENVGNSASIFDVSNNIEKIYAHLAKPLQDLENAEYSRD
ncbi:MAG: AAA family ATPase [Candidatus Adiutrix sp.]